MKSCVLDYNYFAMRVVHVYQLKKEKWVLPYHSISTVHIDQNIRVVNHVEFFIGNCVLQCHLKTLLDFCLHRFIIQFHSMKNDKEYQIKTKQ